jgi:hypothetical protein
MAARQVLGALWAGIVLGAIAMGTAAAQSTPSSSADPTPISAESSSSDVATTEDSTVATPTNNSDAPIKKVGTPFPLRMDPGGYRMGPLHLTNVSTSGFYSVAKPQGQATQTLPGDSVSGDFVYARPINNGLVAVQADPSVYISGGAAYVNAVAGVSFSKQLTQRWSMAADVQWTFYQNQYLLQNPEYLLAYAAGGIVLQTIYAQRNGSTMYESSGFSMNYQLSGRTTLSLTPNVNVSFSDIDGTSNLLTQFGGGSTVTHFFTPNRSAFVYANVAHANIMQVQGSGPSGWNTYSMGGGFNQKIGQNWYVGGSIGASQQSGANSTLVPTGGASLMKAFHRGTISAAYSRTTAAGTLLSSGYFDQADFAFVRQFGSKVSTSVSLGTFRSINTGTSNHGRRANASVYYRWRRNLGWVFSYSYTDQTSTQATLYSGQTSTFRAGLTWTLGQPGAR